MTGECSIVQRSPATQAAVGHSLRSFAEEVFSCEH